MAGCAGEVNITQPGWCWMMAGRSKGLCIQVLIPCRQCIPRCSDVSGEETFLNKYFVVDFSNSEGEHASGIADLNSFFVGFHSKETATLRKNMNHNSKETVTIEV